MNMHNVPKQLVDAERMKLHNRRRLDVLHQQLEKAGARKAKKIRSKINGLLAKQMDLFKSSNK